jgi:hypothetical protein
MNDTELDNLLNTWTAPAPPPSLRARVRAGYATLTPKARRRFRLSFWAIVFVFAVVATAAFPKAVKLVVPAQIPYTVDTDTTTFGRDGTIHELLMTTYMRNGVEMPLARKRRDEGPLKTLVIQILNDAYFDYSLVFPPVAPHRWAEFVASGCSNEGTVVGHETILGYQTTVTEHRSPSRDRGDVLQDGRKITLWQAPDLGCFDLKMVHEQQNSDGTYRLVEERHALKVTVNP